MNKQVNIRLPGRMLNSARSYAKEHGFGNLQEFIKETVREKLFEKPAISKDELKLIITLLKASDEKNLYGTEKELFKRLNRK